ncbi:MAG: hypothetical protein IJ065_00025 [Eubacterium sp.]|nr:hypothetical protein [Eubacterium sp.]
MKLKKKLRHFLVTMLAIVMTLSNLNGVGTVVYAAGESELAKKVDHMEMVYAINHSNGDQDVYPWEDENPPVVTYGDTLYFELAWDFKDEDVIDTSDVFTYTLPEMVEVENITDKPITDTNNKVVGTYSIKENVIKVNYTDESFCKRDKKNSYITFQGSINKNKNGTQNPTDETIIFPDAAKMTFRLKPSDIESEIYVRKLIWNVDPSRVPDGTPEEDKNYIYRTKIRFTSKGNNNDIVFDDEMWPGMTLYSDPVFYSDDELEMELDSSDFGLTYSLKGTKIHAVIPHMGNLDQIWVSYLVKIDPAMYSFDTANQFLETNDPKEYYPGRQYTGKVSNKATVSSKDDPEGSRSWGSVYTIGGGIDKWANPSNHKVDEGMLNWEITLNSIKRPDYKDGYLIDTLPKNVSLVKDSVEVRDINSYAIINDAVDISILPQADGTTDIRYDFNESLLNHLKTSEEAKAVIIYYTKIDRQEPAVETYRNTAKVYYDGDVPVMQVEASDIFIKPSPLDKTHEYTRLTAPNIEFTVDVNSAALDLDPDVDDLVLEDSMSDSYSLIVDSVTINGKKPEDGVFSYDPQTGRMTFDLKDGVAYKIKYEARVNLKAGSQLTKNEETQKGNSFNDVSLYAVKPGSLNENISYSFSSEVFLSSAGASSVDKATLNVIKYSDGNVSDLLNGAKFSLTKMSGSTFLTADGEPIVETTGGNDGKGTPGTAVFGGLERGVIYMLEETEAPENYVKDSTPVFYAFEDTAGSLPSTVTYNGKNYALNITDESKSIKDDYISNVRKTSDLEVKKEISDPDGKAIISTAGFEVTLKDSNGNYIDDKGGFTADKDTASYKTVTAAASCKFENLPVGETFTVEEKTPSTDSISGYKYTGNNTDKVGTVKIAENGNTVTVTNSYELQEGTLIIKKVFENAPSDIDKSKITFEVTDSADYKETVKYSEFESDGTYKIENLPVGEYTVTETVDASEAEKEDNEYTYKLKNTAAEMTASGEVKDGGETTVTITNTYEKTAIPVQPKTGTLIIKKVFENAPSDIDKSKITFEVTDSADYKETVKYSEFESDGTYKIENLPVGEYTVTEKIEESELSKEEGGYKYTFDTEKSTTDLKVVDEVTDGGETEFSITNAYTKEEIPKEPETPETPEKPVATPTDPATPTEPTQPETPETPEVPEEPKEPEVPETPGNTEKSEVPETPESAKTPENPTNQDVTKEPETPKAETVTDTTVITDTEKTDNDKKSTTVTDSTKKTADTDNTKKTTDTNVKTGDSGRIMLTVMGILALISMAYIGLWMFLRRKKNK